MRARLPVCVAVAVVLNIAVPSPRAASLQFADARVTALVTQAEKASLALNFQEAHARADEGIALAESIGDRVGLAMSYRIKGRAYAGQGRPREGSEFYGRALAAFEALGIKAGVASALAGLTATAAQTGETQKLREFGNRAIGLFRELGDDRGRAQVLVILVNADDSPDEDAWLQEIVSIGERLGDNMLLGNAYQARGGKQFNAGDLLAASVSYEAAIVALGQTPDVTSLAANHLSLGRVFRAHGDYEGALQHYRKAIDLLAPTGERYTIVEATNASAIALGHLGRHQEALALYERGLALAREGGNQRMIDFMEGNLAGGLVSSGQYERAIPALEAIIARKPEPSIAGYRYSQLATALTRAGRAAQALTPSSESVRIARELKQIDQVAVRLDGRAELLTTLGRLEEALADSRESVAIVEQIRTTLMPSDFLKRGYADRNQRGNVRIVDLLSRLGRGSEALGFAERGRSRAFLDLLAAREAGAEDLATRGGATASLGGRPDLASAMEGKTLDIAGIRAVAQRLESTVLAFWVTDEATLIWVIRPDADPVHMRVPMTRDKVAALVAATTAPLRQTAKSITTRGTDAGGEAGAVPQATAEDLTALPMRGLGLLALSRDDKAAWRELYRTLIEPVRAQLPARGGRVTIVPHGPLFQLSFAALADRTGRYLLEDYDIHYAPAVSALEFTGRRQQEVATYATGPWAIVGNPAALPLVDERVLPPLPGAAREMSSIAALAPGGRALRLTGAGADEAALVRALDASHPSVLHFATHGFVFDDPQKETFLALNRRGMTDADDGRLTLDEVYGLRLTTDLVVLSACRTGSGQVTSDGIVGLTRGFFYAGSPSVIATFWDVTDAATAILMPDFYRGYVRKHEKSASLRTAQLALLAQLRAGRVIVTASGRRVTLPEHPLLWAGFFLSGEP